MTRGYVHSQESFGTVDGPGTRYVVFLQGCPMRCQYCHNPDTWEPKQGTLTTAEEILDEFEKNRPFYRRGGLTVTGGEPLLQLDFVAELFSKARKRDIHTCLDTSGITYQPESAEYTARLDALLDVTNLVMLDIKHIRSEAHKALTGHPNERILAFASHLDEKGIPVWIRHVVVPGITDQEEDLKELGRFIGGLGNLKALDVLPYHTMGKAKYESLGLPYPLNDTPECTKEEALTAKSHILQGIRERRSRDICQ